MKSSIMLTGNLTRSTIDITTINKNSFNKHNLQVTQQLKESEMTI